MIINLPSKNPKISSLRLKAAMTAMFANLDGEKKVLYLKNFKPRIAGYSILKKQQYFYKNMIAESDRF